LTKKSDLIGNIAVRPSVRLCLRWSLALTSLATYICCTIYFTFSYWTISDYASSDLFTTYSYLSY